MELADSRIGAWELYDTGVKSFLMEGYRPSFTSLAGATVHNLLIRTARIGELDLDGIDAQQVRSGNCQVDTLCLYGEDPSGVDLCELEMGTVNGVGSLAGATISSGQLSEPTPLLAQHLRLRVTDQDHTQNTITRNKRT